MAESRATLPPIRCRWDGEAFIPERRFARICDNRFIIGELYPLVVEEERSQATHNHYFAAVHDAWVNLPDDMAERWPTAEHLRKWALIKAGYRDERTVPCATAAEAQRVRALVKGLDDYAVVLVHENVVSVFTAKTQSTKAMKKAEFQESKQKVLDVLAELIGVRTRELERAAGQAA